MAKVILKHVYKYYDKNLKPAVSDFNLEIEDKEFIVFVGPSGCGKSTTMRMVAGLEHITEGEVYIGDKLVNNVEPKNRDIAMVFQNYALYPHMTVFKNMAFGLTIAKIPKEQRDENKQIVLDENGQPVYIEKKHNFLTLLFSPVLKEERDENKQIVLDENGQPVYAVKKNKDGSVKLNSYGKIACKKRLRTIAEIKAGIGSTRLDANGNIIYKTRKYTKQEIKEKVEEAARILDIQEYLGRKPGQLSGGQRQRVAIGRSIVRKPKVFLMDEPLSNLDAKLRNQMRAEIKILTKKINTTFIYVTHDQVEAMTLGDRIVVMKDGVIQQIGTPEQVFDHPTNLFVAGFIGAPQMNLFKAQLVKNKGRYIVQVEGKDFALSDRMNDCLVKNDEQEREIILGIRPEHIHIKTKISSNVKEHLSRPEEQYIKADVTVSEMMGSELYIHATLSNNQNVVIRAQTLGLTEEEKAKLNAGGTVEFTAMEEALHLFDCETERNLCPID